MARELFDLGVLTSVDRAALTAYCVAYEQMVTARVALSQPGVSMVVVNAKGEQVQNQWVRVMNMAMDQMRKYMVEFGMTPSSRSRVTVTKQTEPSLDELLGLGGDEDEDEIRNELVM